MSQTLVPSDQPQQTMTVVPTASPPPAHMYEPEPPRRQSVFWRAVKWPLRQVIKGIYLVLAVARGHRAVTLVVLLMLLGGGIATYSVYRATHPDVVVSVDGTGKPDLPSSVLHALHGIQTYDAREFWDSLSPVYQAALMTQGRDETSFAADFTRYRGEQLTFPRFVYTGGYRDAQDGASYYTIQMSEELQGQQASVGLYFAVDAGGAITYYQTLPLTPPQATPVGG